MLKILRVEQQGQKRVRESRGSSANGRLQAGGKSRSKTGGWKTGKHWGRAGKADSQVNMAVCWGEDSDVYSLSDDVATSDPSECYDSEERRWREYGDESGSGGAASTSAGAGRGSMLMTWRKGKVVDTPTSWHGLVHAGVEKCVESARQSEGLFNVPGNVKEKKGQDLTTEELRHFVKAANDCTGCRQLKMTKPKVPHSRSANAERVIVSSHGSRRD